LGSLANPRPHQPAKLLVWFDTHTDIREAIIREKQRKRWNRDWKINLIQSTNPAWRDLYPRIVA